MVRPDANTSLRAHADDWLAAWNAHDTEAIMNCCTDEVVFIANAGARWRKRHRSLRGKSALHEHVTRHLTRSPKLVLTEEAVFVTSGGYALLCRRENGDRTVETVELDREGRAARVTVFDENTARPNRAA
jgi:ketosteroid isomerase-like protein